MCVTSNAQITQNNTFANFLQCLNKEVSDEIDFLHANKYESFLQVDIMICGGDGQTLPKVSQAVNLQCLNNS